MKKAKPKTKLKDKSENLTERLNQFAEQNEANQKDSAELRTAEPISPTESEENKEYREEITDAVKALFNEYENEEFIPKDFQTDVPVASMESAVGYSSLIRQMQQGYLRRIAYHRSEAGGCLSIEESRKRAFHVCTNEKEALKIFDSLMSMPLEILDFVDLAELQSYSAERGE